MPVYIALIQQDAHGVFNVSFPDFPGVVTTGDSLDEAIEEAEETLEYAAEDWRQPDGAVGLPAPRTLDQLRDDAGFVAAAEGGVIVEIDYEAAE